MPDPWERRKAGRSGTVLSSKVDRLISMAEPHILWPTTKIKASNHSQMVRDLLERGEWKTIMESSRRVKGDGRERKISAMEGPIYSLLMDSMAAFEALLIFMLLFSGSLLLFIFLLLFRFLLLFILEALCIMSRLWRARSRARGPNQGASPSEASPSEMDESMPSLGKEIPAATPFNWGEQYMVEMP